LNFRARVTAATAINRDQLVTDRMINYALIGGAMPARPDFAGGAGRGKSAKNSNACEWLRFVENLESRDFDLSPTTAVRFAFKFKRQRPEAAFQNHFAASETGKTSFNNAEARADTPAKYEQPIRKRSGVKRSGANDRRRGSEAREGKGGREKPGGIRAHEGTLVRSAFCATKRLISHFPSGRGTR